MEDENTCSTNCGCGNESCGCGSCECGDFYEALEGRLMQMTFFAHKSVLFEKIKQRIEKEDGEKLDKVAELLVESARNKFKSEQEAEKKRAELREKIKETFEE